MINSRKGWRVTGCAIGINLACGMLYSWSVYAAALVENYGFTRTQASIPYTIAIAMLALLSIPGGRLQDKIGPRICATVAGVLCGAGLILSGFSSSILMIAIAFGVITGSGCGLANGATTPAAVKWFPPHKRGLISGLVVAGIGLSSVYVAPLTQFLVNRFGVNQTFMIKGVLFAIVILILAQFLENPPAGYIPEGMKADDKGKSAAEKKNYSPGEMLRTPQFYLIWLMYACGAIAGLMVIGHMATIAKIQANIEWAFVFVAILAVFNASGRVVGGVLSDKLGRKKTLMIMFSLQAINMLLFNGFTTSATLLLGIAGVGICYGSLLAIFPALTFDFYGMKNGGVNYGIVFSSWGFAGVIGPIMAGRIVDMTQSYHTAYLVAAGLLGVSVLLATRLKSPNSI